MEDNDTVAEKCGNLTLFPKTERECVNVEFDAEGFIAVVPLSEEVKEARGKLYHFP